MTHARGKDLLHRIKTALRRFISDRALPYLEGVILPLLIMVAQEIWAFIKYVLRLAFEFLGILSVFIARSVKEMAASLAREVGFFLRTVHLKAEKRVDYAARRNLVALNLVLMLVLLGMVAPDAQTRRFQPITAYMLEESGQIRLVNSIADPIPLPKPIKYARGLATQTLVEATRIVEKIPLVNKITVKTGDTIGQIFASVGLSPAERELAIASLKKNFNPRTLSEGQKIEVRYDPATGFSTMRISSSVEEDIVLRRVADGSFVSEVKPRPLQKLVEYREAKINGSLFKTGNDAGIPSAVMADLTDAFAYDFDFQRELRKDDQFAVLYEKFVSDEGKYVRSGRLLKAMMMVKGEVKTVYHFASSKDSEGGYYDMNGQSVRRALLRTPLKYSRVSSGFGMREHPILGFNKMHTGVDFSAPTGTPIRAAGDGIVAERGWKGGYGRYVRIRHNGEYSTAYAHMSHFAENVPSGKRVKQGDIIGYVGSSGRSTGPHLHYEMLKYGKFVNPMSVKFASGDKLQGAQLAAYKNHIGRVEQRLAEVRAKGSIRLAANEEFVRPTR